MYQASVSISSNCSALMLAALLTSASLSAQTDQGQIAGTVRDASDAVVPSATVTAASTQGSRHSAITGENGSYVLTNLPVGFYQVRVEAPGFKAFVTSNVKVDVAARSTVDFRLEVGAVTESVLVTASAVQMQMETAQIGRTVESKQITDLALNGRNPINLTLLKAGVVGGNFNNFNPNNLHESFAVNGGRRNGNNVTVDGVNAVRTRGDFTSSAQVGLFNVDTIQEVQILTSTYPAEFGRAMDGQIRFVTKGGSREFHGSAWHFLRNSVLDANSWTRNQSPNPNDSRRAAPFRFNQPGYTIGGPVVIPGLGNQNRDKLFFFLSQEWLMWRRERTVTNTVPSLRMRQGDFSELLDPANPFFRRTRVITDALNGGVPFPNNVIPPSRLSSNGIALLRAYPEPTAGFLQGTENWIKTLPNPRDSRKDTFRIDYMPGIHRVNLVGNLYSHTEDDPFISNLDRSNSRWDRPNQTGSIGITSTWTPTVITDFSFSAANDVVFIGIYDNEGESRYRRGQYGLNFPYIVPGSKRIDDRIPRAVLANFATLDGSSRPVSSSGPMYNLTGNLTKVTNSAHTFKFGGWISHDQQNNNDQSGAQQNGEFSFVDTGHPLTSGLAVANAALGYFDQYTEQGTAAYTLLRSNSVEAYAQDTWRASRNLTLEMGVRYAYHQPWYAKWNDIANFDERFFDPARRTVVDPIGGFIVSGDPYNGVVLPGDGFPESARGRANGQSLPGVERLFHGLPRGFVNSYKNAFAPRLGVAYRIGDMTVIRAGGGVFHHRQMHNQGSLFRNAPNQVQVQVQNGVVDQPGGATRRDFPFFIRALDLNAKYPTAYSYSFSVQRQVPGSIVVDLAYVGKRGVNQERTRNINQLLPGTANRGINVAALRPYYGLGQIDLTERTGRTSYDSLQVSVDRRFASGLGFGLSYTFSKTISDINTPFNSNAYVKALDDQDRPHVLNVNYIYELPLFRGQRGWKGNALGGWQISGVTFFRSGSLFSVTDGPDVAGVGPGAAQTWDVVGGQSLYVSGETGVGLPWFNKAAFARPRTGTFGNAGYNTIRGPQFVNWDAALFKKFTMTERVRSEFRFEVFNFPNHPLLGNPIVAPQSGTFGQITSKTGERNVQLGFKVAF
jgi:hypothetical protein